MPAYKDKHGRWRYRFTYNGERHSGSAPKGNNTKKVAGDLEKAHIEKLAARIYVGVMPSIAEFAPRFLEHQQATTKPLSYRSTEMIVRLHVVPRIGKLKLDAIDTAVLDRLKLEWRPAAAKTINTRLALVKTMLGLAREWRFLQFVPTCKKLKEHDKEETPRWLDDAESQRLLEAARAFDRDGKPERTRRRSDSFLQWAPMVLVGMRTGLRIGELRGLQWGDLDLERHYTLRVRRTSPGRANYEAGSPKGNKHRTLPLTTEARTELEALRAKQPHHAGDLVFPARDPRRARHETTCIKAMAAIATMAGFTEQDDIGWHTLRHTFASQLVARGVPLRVIQQLLGHASISTTEIYAHLAPNAVHHDAVRSLDFALLTAALASTSSGPDPESQGATKALPEPPGSANEDA